jgi:hypothetical protein
MIGNTAISYYIFGMGILSNTTSSGVFLGRDRQLRLTWRILLVGLGFFGCVLIIGTTIAVVTAWLPPVISQAAGGLGVTASTLGLVFLLRRHADRRPWSRIGLTLGRAMILQLLLGAMLATVVATVSAAATVQLGFADWGGRSTY